MKCLLSVAHARTHGLERLLMLVNSSAEADAATFLDSMCHIRNARSRTSAACPPVGAGVEELIGWVRLSVMSCAAALKCDANRMAADLRAQNTRTPSPPKKHAFTKLGCLPMFN